MFLIESKIVQVGAEKNIMLINNKFTLNLKILEFLLMKWNIMLVVKFYQKYLHGF